MILGSLVTSAASSGAHLAHASAWAVYGVGAALILTGAFGVILMRNPVHSALMLVVTLLGVALEFIDQSADFLAAVQIIVYAGAVVILFLFVIMFLGVDRREPAGSERTPAQRPLAVVLGIVALIEILVLSRVNHWTSGFHSFAGALSGQGKNVDKLGQSLYTRYLLPFEMTAALLVIAVVAAVVLSRSSVPSAGEMSQAEQDRISTSPDEDQNEQARERDAGEVRAE
jgi:NADH-quinone oxidoreductase subunit J